MAVLTRIRRLAALALIFSVSLSLHTVLPVYAEEETSINSQTSAVAAPSPSPQVSTVPEEPVEFSAVESSARGIQGDIGVQGSIGRQPEVSVTATPLVSESSQANTGTGAESQNTNAVTTDTTTDASVTRDATINNNADLELNTGDNTVSRNTDVGNVKTGSIDGAVTLINTANSTFADGSSVGVSTLDATNGADITLRPSQQRQHLQNAHTGSDSQNVNMVDGTNVARILEENTATTENTVGIYANTGENVLEDNTRVQSLETGDVNLALNLINLLNVYAPNTVLAVDVWSVLGDMNGDFVLPEFANVLTGSDSLNQNTSSHSTNKTLTVRNTAHTTNEYDVSATTGNNVIADNTRTGNITTGNTLVDGVVTTVQNVVKPVLYIFNVFGEWAGSLLGDNTDTVIVNEFGNTTTGSSSENINTSIQDTDIAVEQRNDATVNNRVAIRANTGNNSVQRNTEVGNIKTGDISVFSNVVNVLNSFGESLSNFRIGIVNIFGNWKGSVKTSATENSQPAEQLVAAQAQTEENRQGSAKDQQESSSVLASVQEVINRPVFAPRSASRFPSQNRDSDPAAIAGSTRVETQINIRSNGEEHAASISANDEGVLVKGYTRSAASDGAAGLPIEAYMVLGIVALLLLAWGGVELVVARRGRK